MSAKAYVGPPADPMTERIEWGIKHDDGRIFRCVLEEYARGEVARQLSMGRNAQLLTRRVGRWEVAPLVIEEDCDEYAAGRAAEAAACTCPGCMTGQRCVEDQPEDGDDDASCSFCPADCAICLDTANCDCPTHGGDE